jgi:apolipoprotein D and lipocalin family protein
MISPALYAGVLTLVMGATPMTSPSRVAMTHAATPVTTVASVDLDRYAGEWFEIARFPNRFQEKCAGEVKAVYARRPDGRVDVTNTCRTSDGATTAARGVARVVDQATRSKLKVRFAPAVLSFLPFVWGDYWIIGLDADYRWAVVGSPDRKYLWVLSRTAQLPQELLDQALARARANGFDVSKLQRTRQAGA